jgi:hypothetical protein
MTRASRRLRLPTSTVVGKTAKWVPNDESWSRIETAYDVTLNEDMRAKIGEIVNKYFENEPLVRDAPFVDDMVGWLTGLHDASAAFLDAYGSTAGLPRTKAQKKPARTKSAEVLAKEAAKAAEDAARARRGRYYIECLLNDQLNDLGGGIVFRSRDLVQIMLKFGAATQSVANEIRSKEHPQFDERSPWRAMMARLWFLAEDAGLSTSLNANQDAKRSPFVRFVLALQSTFCDVPAWYQDKPDTLIEEIKKAVREAKAAREARKIKGVEF